MKNRIVFLLIMFSFTAVLAQEKDMKITGNFYTSFSMSYYHNFKIENIIVSKGADKIPKTPMLGSFGLEIGINQLIMSLDLSAGGMISKNKKTKIIVFPAKFSIGYKMKNNGLLLGGSLSYHLLGVRFHNNNGKDTIFLDNNIIPSSNQANLFISQLMIGPIISYKWSWCNIRIGYDIGCIPFQWKSSEFTVKGGKKEMINRLYIEYIVNISSF